MSNLVNLVNKCKSFGVMDLFVSGTAFNKRLPYTLIKKFSEKILNMCSWPTIFTRPNIKHFEEKNSRPDF